MRSIPTALSRTVLALLAATLIVLAGSPVEAQPGVPGPGMRSQMALPAPTIRRVHGNRHRVFTIGGSRFQTETDRGCRRSACEAACDARRRECESRTEPPYCNIDPFCNSACASCPRP